MGCDIHMHIEVKVDGGWLHYAHPCCSRNYKIFGKLAGVRVESIEHFEVKGLPKDISKLTALHYLSMEGDVHTASYITGKEIVDFSVWMHNTSPIWNGKDKSFAYLQNDLEYSWFHTYLFGNSFAGFFKYPEERPKGIEDIRFVFWFDN